MWKIKLAIALTALAIFAYIFAQNIEPVKFSFQPLGEINVSKTALILVSAALGSVATLAAQWFLGRGRRRR